MACLEICNNNSSATAAADNPTAANYFSGAPLMSHRISFSNDFVESSSTTKQPPLNAARAPASFDFEFSVSGNSMMSAEELIFKGQMLPYKDAGGGRKTTTLREELLAGDEEVGSKGSMATRWKGLLRKAHIGSKTTVGSKLSETVTAPPCLVLP